MFNWMVLKQCLNVNSKEHFYNDAIPPVFIPTRQMMQLNDKDATADVSLWRHQHLADTGCISK